MTSKSFKQFINNQVSSGMSAFKYLSYDSLEDKDENYDPLDEGLKDADNVSCNFRYIHTAVRLILKRSWIQFPMKDILKMNAGLLPSLISTGILS